MKYVLCYWEDGKYNYQDLASTEFKEAENEAINIMEDEHIDAYMRNEWQLQTL